MTEILLYFLIVELALMILWGLWKPNRVFQFPFLAGCVFALWAWPQFYQLFAAGAVPHEMVDRALFMTILCSGMCYVGYQKGTRPIEQLNWTFDRNRLCQAAFFLTTTGWVFAYKLSRLPKEMLETGAWSGAPVMLMFLAVAINFGFGLSVLLLLRRFSWWVLLIAVLGALSYVQAIVFGGRREQSVQFALMIGTLFWFVRRKIPPRAVIVCAILAGAFLCYNISTYRSVMAGVGWFRTGGQLEKLKEMKEVTDQGTEMRNAAYYIAATQSLGAFDFGLFQWNLLVFRNFPGQIFGAALKQNLMSLGGLVQIGANAARAYGYQTDFGSTTGGITDAFASFWYFGCLEFFLIGYFMRRVYESALRGSLIWQLGCALLAVDSLLAITHTTNHFLTAWVQAAFFLGPAFLYARARPGERNREIITSVPASNGTIAKVESRVPVRKGGGRICGVAKFSARLPQFELRRWNRRSLHFSRLGRKLLTSRLPQRFLGNCPPWKKKSLFADKAVLGGGKEA